MRHGWVYIYENAPATERLDELLSFLKRRGLSLAHPPTGRIIRLSKIGEQITSTEQDMRAQLAKSEELAFNFYIDSDSTNVVCSIHKLDNAIVREGYSLDGKTEDESKFVINILLEFFREQLQRETEIAFVADQYAELHQTFHWDDFILGDQDEPPEWPLALGLPADSGKTSRIPNALYLCENAKNFILYRRAGPDQQNPNVR